MNRSANAMIFDVHRLLKRNFHRFRKNGLGEKEGMTLKKPKENGMEICLKDLRGPVGSLIFGHFEDRVPKVAI